MAEPVASQRAEEDEPEEAHCCPDGDQHRRGQAVARPG